MVPRPPNASADGACVATVNPTTRSPSRFPPHRRRNRSPSDPWWQLSLAKPREAGSRQSRCYGEFLSQPRAAWFPVPPSLPPPVPVRLWPSTLRTAGATRHSSPRLMFRRVDPPRSRGKQPREEPMLHACIPVVLGRNKKTLGIDNVSEHRCAIFAARNTVAPVFDPPVCLCPSAAPHQLFHLLQHIPRQDVNFPLEAECACPGGRCHTASGSYSPGAW